MMAFPLILAQTSSSIAFALQQEAVLASKTYIGTVLSHDWDKNSVNFPISGGKALVINTSGSSDFTPTDDLRKGHIEGIGRRKMLRDLSSYFNATTTSSSEWANSDKTDIDDFDKKGEHLVVVTDNMDSILEFDLNSTVIYIADGANYDDETITFSLNTNKFTPGTSNIKMIEVSASNKTNDVNITLRAYSSNIGEYDLLERGTW